MAPPPRLFAALSLPDPLRQEFFLASDAIARLFPAAVFRRVPPGNLHLTLRFFGPETGLVDRARLGARLRARLATAGLGPLALRASEVSAFASPRRARVIWVRIEEVGSPEDASGRLLPLQREVEAVARDLGLVPERRPFVPHVTLGRLRTPLAVPVEALAAARSGASESAWAAAFTVRELVLFASVLTPGGAIYEPLDRFSLEAG